MSTRVDYYLLDQFEPQAVLHYSCRLLNKAYQAGLRIFVLTDSAAQSQAIDQLLWTALDANFIPHALADRAEAADPLTRICISHLPGDPAGFDMLVNLRNSDRLESTQYERVAELVSADEAHKKMARKRYAAWRATGAEQKLHDIRIH